MLSTKLFTRFYPINSEVNLKDCIAAFHFAFIPNKWIYDNTIVTQDFSILLKEKKVEVVY